jgi:hypothetical protein
MKARKKPGSSPRNAKLTELDSAQQRREPTQLFETLQYTKSAHDKMKQKICLFER